VSESAAFKLTVSEASRLIHGCMLSPSQLLESLLQRIEKLEPKLEAWVTIDEEGLIAAAKRYSKEAAEGKFRGILHGIPIGVKDIYYTAGMKTAAGSNILSNFVPSYDATTVAKLKKAGAIILGKTETTEFACFDPAPTRNPWNTKHTPGGSSSGSAAAVSAGMCPAALGSQTGGSTIRPAAYCGLVGLKPTYGRISRYGIIPVSWSLDHVGIIARTVEDVALLLEVLAGYDSNDASSSSLSVHAYRSAIDSLTPPRLSLLYEFFQEKSEEEVWNNFKETVKRLSSSGAMVVDTPLPRSFAAVHDAHRTIMITEAAAYHEETFRSHMTDYRPYLRGMIATGLLMPASTYLKAQRIRSLFIREILATLEGFDCFLMPATTTPAPAGLSSTGDPSFNSPWSFCGFPAITLPSGLTKDSLPLGIQLVGRPFEEERLLSVASWCEKILRFGHNVNPEARCPINQEDF
jgi:aspartyl-tRNA(Asn)/glutamyl-tRNA(Gln) amidotransferase subunit A